MTKFERLFRAGLMGFLAIGAGTAHADQFDPTGEIYALERMTLAVPPVGAESPAIDGVIGGSEWERAAAVTGFYDYTTGALSTAGPLTFVNYSAEKFSILTLVPRDKANDLIARETKRDGDVYKDDSIELYFASGGQVYQFVVNPLGTVADYRDGNSQWNGNAVVKSGTAEGKSLPAHWGLADSDFWFVESSIPVADLGVTLTAGSDVLFNVAVNKGGKPTCVLSPVAKSTFADPTHYVALALQDATGPYAQLTSVGRLRFGDIQLQGRIFNPSASSLEVMAEVDVRKKGSYLTKDAYRNVVGLLQLQRQPLTVPAGGHIDLDLKQSSPNLELDQFGTRILTVEKGEVPPRTLMARSGPVQIEPPLVVTLGNVQPRKYFVLGVDASGLKANITTPTVPLSIVVLDKEGKTVHSERKEVALAPSDIQVSYAKLPIGNYSCKVAVLSSEGKALVERTVSFRHIAPPKWLTDTTYDDYGKQDRVPLPWIPVTANGKTISIWGRSLTWGNSLLPSSIKATGTELLKQPMLVVLQLDGKSYTVPLGRLRITEKKKSRVSLIAEGQVQGITAVADMQMYFDGFLWVTLRLKDAQANRKVQGLHVVTALQPDQSRLYQTFARTLVGAVGTEPIKIPWVAVPAENILNFYHWMGNEDRGLGFTYRSLEHWAPETAANFCTISGSATETKYSINLIEKPVSLQGRSFQFGIQATPIKPLRPDFHAMMASTSFTEPYRAWRNVPENVDMVLAWPSPHGTAMKGLQDPYHLNEDAMRQLEKDAHDKGVAFMGVASCPQKVSTLDDNFEDYKLDWIALPESILNWEGIPHYQNSGDSYSLRKWLFYAWTENVKKYNMDGVYFDGWQAGQIGSNNPHNGGGWTDENGKRQSTVPVLEGREFNMRMVFFLEDHVKGTMPKNAPKLDGFPKYHYWIHSWEFVPSVMGFATDWMTGEFSGWPLQGPSLLTPEGTYGKTVGLDLFRSRGLSTNWGVPNYFDPLMWENAPDSPNKQTLMAYAWFLPHGVPMGQAEYMNQQTVIEMTKLFAAFKVREAHFTPGWRKNAFLNIVTPTDREVMAATWDHGKQDKVMVVVSNLKVGETRDVTLQWSGFANPKIRNARTGETLALQDGKLTVKLETESFILLQIER
jgi:hypothetical protein